MKGLRAQRLKPKTQSPKPDGSAYATALRLLARRELSEAQVRQRLLGRGLDAGEIETAIARLKSERAIDDERTAEAIARTDTTVKRRGRQRVTRQIERAGIASRTASRAAAEAFENLDEEALLEAALAKRLKGRATIDSDKDLQRLYRYLSGQGFDAERIIALLESKRRRRSTVPPEA